METALAMASLYLHIPFCEHKCVYCDFYSIAPREASMNQKDLMGRFLTALEREIDLRGADPRFHQSYETVFFGGGTPSLLSGVQIRSVLDRLHSRFNITADAEITLETNPGTVGLEHFNAFRRAGINRISMGIQSFYDDDLRFLTRIHNAVQAKEGVHNARLAGFDNVSFDLIFALPGQTMERWQSNLRQAMELAPSHISCYSLIVEPNTPLKRMVDAGQVTLLAPDTDAEFYEETIRTLSAHGYEQYEVSNFARRGFRSRHNGNYWNHTAYLGFGPSAHSFGGDRRWWNISHLVNYCERLERGELPVAGEETLSVNQLADEYLFLGLRGEGLNLARLREQYACDLLVKHRSVIDGLMSDGLAVREGDVLRLTGRGYALCDEICTTLR